MTRKLYVIGSLRNPEIRRVAQAMRAAGWEVFDDWHSCGPEADDHWQRYEQDRGRDFRQALDGHSAEHNFSYDKRHLDECDAAVLVMPAGKSAHLELGYVLGKGKAGYILLDGEPERWDVMYKFADGIFYSIDEMTEALSLLS